MEVKTGYKQTEVGIIPEEWSASSLQNAATNITVGFVGSMAHLFVRDGVPLLRGQNILPQALDLSELKFISAATHQLWKKSALLPRDVAIVRVGYPGTACVIPQGLGDLNAASLVLVRPEETRIDSDYMACVLNSSWGKRQIASLLVGGAQQVFNTRTAAEFLVPLPPLPEQRAIAAALSDVDALLGGLDRLFAKKRDLKQAAMQQLLTGQTRLPGFNGAWEVKRLGELASLYQPETIAASTFTESGYPVYGANGVVGFYHTANHSTWQVTVTCRGSTCGAVNRTVEKCWITGNAMVINCDSNPRLNKAFLYYSLQSQDLSTCITGTGQPQIIRSPLAAFLVKIPTELAEQNAIATVLADMDAELAALEARRAKTHALKQAMMQKLLTGRTRLV